MINAKLPRDADGRYIPLDTEVLYGTDAREHKVVTFEYEPLDDIWRVSLEGCFVSIYASDMHLTPPNHERPDSWDALIADVERICRSGSVRPFICEYWGDVAHMPCGGDACTPFGINEARCIYGIIRDILRRIKALRKAERDED